MKYLSLLFAALLLAGCGANTLEITGTANGVPEATVTLKDGTGETLSGVNLKDEKFQIKNINLQYPDYGSIAITESGKSDHTFEVYLENGEYTISFDKTNLAHYPQITTQSAIQNQLSHYRKMVDSIGFILNKNVTVYDNQYKQAIASLKKPGEWTDSVTALSNKAENERAKLDDVGLYALENFISKQPNNEIAAHLMQGMSIETKPDLYNTVYQKFSPAQKNTEEGKYIGEKLSAMVNLSQGRIAPPIEGTLPNGKPFDLKTLGKKLIVIEFWRAASQFSRINHQTMINNPPLFTKNKDVVMVSVSLDKKRDWWLGSMRDDKVTWPQVSDLKGKESPNALKWAISTTPTYYLLDQQGRIVDRDVQFSEIDLCVERYLSKH